MADDENGYTRKLVHDAHSVRLRNRARLPPQKRNQCKTLRIVLFLTLVGRTQHDFLEVRIYLLYDLLNAVANSLAYPLAMRLILEIGCCSDELSSNYH